MPRRKQRKRERAGQRSELSDQVVVREGGIAAVADDADAVDLEKYLIHLAHLDMPLPLKIELIRAVSDIMQSFVDRAFGNDPVQQAMQASAGENKNDASEDSDVVEFQQSQIQEDDLAKDFRRNAGNNNKNKEQP